MRSMLARLRRFSASHGVSVFCVLGSGFWVLFRCGNQGAAMRRPTESEVASPLVLLTDAYQLSMAAAYFAEGMQASATFSFVVRRYPNDRGYLVAAGLEDVLRYLESWQMPPDGLQYLKTTRQYRDDFLDYLTQLRFTGDVWAMPEGSVCFVDEPLIEVTAPIIQAQLIETYLINQMHLQTLQATKAARCVHAAQGRAVADFSLRRAHGTDAGMKIARASYLAGFSGTSNVLAGKIYGIPMLGTMAHSFVESFDDEADAFRAFARLFPASSTLLVDTYDTVSGIRAAAAVGQEMAARGAQLNAIRLDSGDLLGLSRAARRTLDEAGLTNVKVFVSGGLDEFKIAELLQHGAPIDAFGVGTALGVSADAPSIDCAYKLVEYAGAPRLKLSAQKESLVGAKQVWRVSDGSGAWRSDLLARRDEDIEAVRAEAGVPCDQVHARLTPVMARGTMLNPPPPLAAIREHFAAEFRQLPDIYKELHHPPTYPVSISHGLRDAQDAAIRAIREKSRKKT